MLAASERTRGGWGADGAVGVGDGGDGADGAGGVGAMRVGSGQSGRGWEGSWFDVRCHGGGDGEGNDEWDHQGRCKNGRGVKRGILVDEKDSRERHKGSNMVEV
ncbi:hypothetical protein LIER_39646 [Lithospermum erythrorhizon]|uniref:Uncharacterized protein n=1 Tax=Lithospermum erythrorhizon TaxID=34254 RepID=A0AAV3QL30_LITER